MPLRWALTGMKVSPGIFEIAEFLGKEEVRKRLEYYDFV
jgi:glutamyl-tRNA synthetase